MNLRFVFLFLLCSAFVQAQETYSSLTERALETMWKAKSSTDFQQALKLYEEAFTQFPDSINGLGRYKASVLASELNQNDKAFLYLTPLVHTELDEDGLPGWSYVLGKGSEKEYKNLLNDPRWTVLKEKATQDQRLFYENLKLQEDEFFKVKSTFTFEAKSDAELYEQLKKFNPYLPKNQRDYSVSFPINDSTKTSYFVHLPEHYDPKNRYAVLFILHGAVRGNVLSDYQLASWVLGDWNAYYTAYAEKNNVILVFPKGSKAYNWMTPDDGFYMLPEMLKQLKKAINVDDNKVFVTGHSNGATGSFSYLMKEPTPFAGFYGFNTYPKVFTGGTFIENAKNRSFHHYTTDEDYYYPPTANDSFTRLMQQLQADYSETRFTGFPHWFPAFKESEPAYVHLFTDLVRRQRNPYPQQLTWEFDTAAYGQIDWLQQIKLDTLKPKAAWHIERNFAIHSWLVYNDNNELVSEEVNKTAFDFPNPSGKIKATYANNVFQIETSRIASFSIAISPEMVNLKKKVKVYVNGELYVDKKFGYDRDFMRSQFEKNADRKQIWVNKINVNIK